MFFDVLAVDLHRDEGIVPAARVEGDVFEQILHHRMEAARADVFARHVDLFGDLGDRLDGVGRELQIDVVDGEQNSVLPRQRMLRAREDVDKVLFRERRELDGDGETALKLGDEVFDAGDVESARRDEEHVVRLDGPVLRHHRAALDNGQNVALDALARDVRPARVALCGDLIDLVDEDDAVVFGAAHRLFFHSVVVDELIALFGEEEFHKLLDGDLAALLFGRKHLAEDGAEVNGGAPGDEFHRLGLVSYVRLDDEVIEDALPQRFQKVRFEHFARGLAAVGLFELG